MEPSSSPDMRYKYPYLVGHRSDRRAPRKVWWRYTSFLSGTRLLVLFAVPFPPPFQLEVKTIRF